MASKSILNEKPLQTPHLDVDHLLFSNRDFNIKDTVSPSHLLKLRCWSKDKFLNQNDDIHIWEINFPKYLFPQVYKFPKIIHLCQLCYIPSQRAIVSPNKQILFTITTNKITKCCRSSQTQMKLHCPLNTTLNSILSWTFPRGFKSLRLSS